MERGRFESFRRAKETLEESRRRLENGIVSEDLTSNNSNENEVEFEEEYINIDNLNRELKFDVDGNLDKAYVAELEMRKATDYITDEQKAKDPRIAKLLDLIVEDGIDLKSTDIQISIPTQDVIVRYRIDGRMENHRLIERGAFDAISCRVKHLSGLNISEAKIPQDGRFTHYKDGIGYDIRVSTIPTNKGENISLRLLYKSELSDNLDDLKIREHVLEKYRKAIMAREGLILLTGPTGSGKTTTLYTTIGELIKHYKSEKNIMTIEDPIEYALDGISQSQVNLIRGYDFSDGLRAILRQNPDIILVGEIRDKTTAETAVRASNTGHLVFSTLHANDAVSTAIVMKQLGVEAYNISNSLRIVLNQRLIGKLCNYCKEKLDVSQSDLEMFPEVFEKFEASGCQRCNYTGKMGNLLIIEMLEVNDRFRDLIFKNVTATEMKKALENDDSYYSLHEDLVYHLKNGNISMVDAIHLS